MESEGSGRWNGCGVRSFGGSAVVPGPAGSLAFGDFATRLVVGDHLGDPPLQVLVLVGLPVEADVEVDREPVVGLDRFQLQRGDPPAEQSLYPGRLLGDGADDLAPVLTAGADVLGTEGSERREREIGSALLPHRTRPSLVEQSCGPAQPVLSGPGRLGLDQPGLPLGLAPGDEALLVGGATLTG